ncbi:hypothetical protein AAG906_028062 [Vitis piasezkii]
MPSIALEWVYDVAHVDLGWMQPIANYLRIGEVPEDGKQAHKLHIQASFGGPYLKCLTNFEAQYVLVELHEGGGYSQPITNRHGSKKLLLVATYYFSKWVKVEAYANIKDKDVTKFVWRNVVCQFEIPHTIVIDNGS